MTKTTYRQGDPGTTYTYNDTLVGAVTLVADDAGRVEVTSPAEERVADLLGLQAPDQDQATQPKGKEK